MRESERRPDVGLGEPSAFSSSPIFRHVSPTAFSHLSPGPHFLCRERFICQDLLAFGEEELGMEFIFSSDRRHPCPWKSLTAHLSLSQPLSVALVILRRRLPGSKGQAIQDPRRQPL